MSYQLSPCALAVCTLLSAASLGAHAQENVNAPVLVSATRIDMADQDAPYASEIHTRQDIERSGASSLYDYLAQQTSLQVLPNYGNRYTPQISMRGYGNDGNQNVVLSVNGRRLNNVDMSPQLIGSIALTDIERIEITKGSGSVLFGDGASAGTIQIYTKPRDGASLETYAGNNGTRGGIASVGMVREKFDLSATMDHGKTNGLSDKDPSGHSDQSEANTWRIAAGIQPLDGLKLNLETGASNIDTRYPNSLSLAQFKKDPSMNSGRDYTHQKFESEHWSIGADYQINQQWKVTARHHNEQKVSLYPASNWGAEYDYISNELALQYSSGATVINAGMQEFDGQVSKTTDKTSKKNRGFFLHGQHTWDALTVSAGARKEQVEYRYNPVLGSSLSSDKNLNSWEIGANYKVSEPLSVFANYSDGFVTPDIDRFFRTNPDTYVIEFNGFIEPAKSKTLTVGANHFTDRNRVKVSAFYAKLENEIYYYPEPYPNDLNTNIDKSHKYGLEVQDRFQFTPRVSGLINYAWTRAIIDRENLAAGAYNGKAMPGVSRHSVVLGLNVRVVQNGHLNLTHTWRSSTWASGDFDNNNTQKQQAYQSTDVAYRHQVAKHVEMYAGVSNLFDRSNGMWVRDNAIYPINFERTWKLGARINF